MPPATDQPPSASTAPSAGARRCPPAALTAAAVIVALQATGAAALVIGRDDYGPGGKGLILGLIALGLACAMWARRLRAGGALGLFLFEMVGILVVLGADWSAAVRVGVLASVATTGVLVLSSLHAFPSPELP